MGQLPVRAVLTAGRAVDPEEIQAGPTVQVTGCPLHTQVLHEASVVVTHAGHGTVLKSLAAGVPLVCIPMGRDQKDNTVRVLRLGAGVRLNKEQRPPRLQQPSQKYLNGPNTSQPHAGLRAFSPGKRRIDHELPTRLNR